MIIASDMGSIGGQISLPVAFLLLFLLQLGSCQPKVLVVTEPEQPELFTSFEDAVAEVQGDIGEQIFIDKWEVSEK